MIQAFLLRIADVGVNDLLKGQAMGLGLEFCTKILGLDSELASDGILHVLDGRVEICGGELTHGVCESSTAGDGCGVDGGF